MAAWHGALRPELMQSIIISHAKPGVYLLSCAQGPEVLAGPEAL